MTSQMALKYSALRFWYWRLHRMLVTDPEKSKVVDLTSKRAPKRQYPGGAGTGQRQGPGSIYVLTNALQYPREAYLLTA